MKSNHAFMLLEVVLALSIFSVAVVWMVKSLNAGLNADYEQQRFTNTRLNLQSLLDEALAEPPQESSEEIVPDVFHVSYHRDIRPQEVRLSEGKVLSGIFKITVTAHDTLHSNRVMGTLWSYAAP